MRDPKGWPYERSMDKQGVTTPQQATEWLEDWLSDFEGDFSPGIARAVAYRAFVGGRDFKNPEEFSPDEAETHLEVCLKTSKVQLQVNHAFYDLLFKWGQSEGRSIADCANAALEFGLRQMLAQGTLPLPAQKAYRDAGEEAMASHALKNDIGISF